MRRLEVRLRDRALSDLGDIYSYVAHRSSERIAERYAERLLTACERIGLNPEGGRQRSDLHPGLRLWTVERRAVIGYSIVGEEVVIARILHRGRDLSVLDWMAP